MTPMTDERLEELRQFHFDPRMGLGYSGTSELFAEIDRLRLALTTARVDALQEAAKAVCPLCFSGMPMINEDHHGVYVDSANGPDLRTSDCEAAAIRALLRKETNANA